MNGWKPLLAFSVAILFVPLAAANHTQPIEGNPDDPIVFDHKVGNEWWVEVKVTAHAVDYVYARSEKGTYKQLTLRSWGNWAGSFHIPPGERVQFMAGQSGGMSDVYNQHSCFFTHPAGVEQCDRGSTDPTRHTFRDPSGNRWWEQVYVDSNRPVNQVFLSVDSVNGPKFYPMTKRSWGAWATSVEVPQGYTVQFFANDGAKGGESACYRWVQATVTDCPPSYGPNPIAPFMARFDHKAGNEWWIEVAVGPVEPGRVEPAKVFARDEGGPWVPLTMRSWGNWAASFHIEQGHDVQFMAVYNNDSEAQRTSCWFTHPGGISTHDGNQICRNVEANN